MPRYTYVICYYHLTTVENVCAGILWTLLIQHTFFAAYILPSPHCLSCAEWVSTNVEPWYRKVNIRYNKSLKNWKFFRQIKKNAATFMPTRLLQEMFDGEIVEKVGLGIPTQMYMCTFSCISKKLSRFIARITLYQTAKQFSLNTETKWGLLE